MPSREDKERKLRKNVEVNTTRAIQYREQDLKRELTDPEKQYYRDAFEESANRIDRSGKLVEIWNPEGDSAVERRAALRGLFGGVTFDKNGKIVK